MLRKSIIAIVLALLVAGIAGCGVSDKENQANIKELTERGFVNPALKEDGLAGGAVRYDVGLGTCRIQLTKGNGGRSWMYGKFRDVDATRLRAEAKELGLEACFSAPPTPAN